MRSFLSDISLSDAALAFTIAALSALALYAAPLAERGWLLGA